MFRLIFIAILTVCSIYAEAQSRIVDIRNPELRIFLPDDSIATGKAVVICPGGAYGTLAKEHEGYDWIPFFNRRGIAAAVLSYRLP